MPQILSVSWLLDVQMMIGMLRVSASRLMARVAWNPLSPGMTTSIRITSGFNCLAFWIASSPLSLAMTSNPALVSMSFRTCRSVGESSTMRIFLIAMILPCLLLCPPTPPHSEWTARVLRGRGAVDVCRHGLQQAFLGERLGQVLVGADHASARPVEQAVLGRQHDHGGRVE